jgi:ribonucleoside-diphosphate reductase alpha chain
MILTEPFVCDVCDRVWRTKYQYKDNDTVYDQTIDDTWRRVAKAVAAVEDDSDLWAQSFHRILTDFRFLPGGRILAGAGTGRRVTLFNCFVMNVIKDSMDGIFDALKEGAITMQQGGGVGYDFSTLRPAGTYARTVGNIASGPVSFMRIWDKMCATILSTGARRGAMMATLRCDHPDIEQFIDAKQDKHELRHFNLSVLVSNAFMEAVQSDRQWSLVFPADRLEDNGKDAETIETVWSDSSVPVVCRVIKHVRARALWERLMRATYDYAEPGVLFLDRINSSNPLWYRERITATNPCGEVPLPPYGACNLGSINLTRFVLHAFQKDACIDWTDLIETTKTAVRFLDNVIDISRYPLEAQRDQAQGTRRIGLGITGLGDALAMLGLRYDSDSAREQAQRCIASICHTAYRTSIELSRVKGSFPSMDRNSHLGGAFIQSLPEDIRDGIAESGLRNSHLLAIAPTGSISLLANNISSGVEPIYDLTFTRRIVEPDGEYSMHSVDDFAWRLWCAEHEQSKAPACFVTAREISPQAHLQMQAVLQPYVDQAISKTINVSEEAAFSDFKDLYHCAYEMGLKGCTTYRANPVTGEVLSLDQDNIHCCVIEREGD